ncbi:MAG: nuclease-related domain-containing protein [Nostoc sp.]|uniref:nuclease-related domain-containing protein n=1 Tax=Nostoc sp. TaxID=1180 RepID=UPI002FFC71D6
MRTLQQSPSLRAAFQQKIDTKKSTKHQEIHETLGDGFLGGLGSFMFEVNQATNKFKGNMGEWGVSLLLQSFPDTGVIFNNALIPTNSGSLTEIDHLIIGEGGVFLVEVKTWKGSFSAYKDKWKRREGNNWVVVDNSPTSQSVYHQKMFSQWITSLIPNLDDRFVAAPVVFPIAKWIGTNDCSVPVLQGIPALLQMINSSPDCLTPMQVQAIAQAVENLIFTTNTTQFINRFLSPNLFCARILQVE